MLISSVFITYILRFSYESVNESIAQIVLLLSILILFNSITFFFFKTFCGILIFSSFSNMLKIFFALTIGYALTYVFIKVLVFSHNSLQIDAQVFILSYILNAGLMIFLRIIVKDSYDLITNQNKDLFNVFIMEQNNLKLGLLNHSQEVTSLSLK